MIVYSGGIDEPTIDALMSRLCKIEPDNQEVVLSLTTYGGSPDAAFRLAKLLQRRFGGYQLMVTRECKSAGTIIAIGASEISMGPKGELGPLDVQIRTQDELLSRESGLEYSEGIVSTTQHAFSTFEYFFTEILERSGGILSTQTASSIATRMTTGLFSPITAQVDPKWLGRVQRANRIALAYGARLNRKHGNLKEGALERLLYQYPSHSFAIELSEAKELFEEVRPAPARQLQIFDELRDTMDRSKRPFLVYEQPKAGEKDGDLDEEAEHHPDDHESQREGDEGRAGDQREAAGSDEGGDGPGGPATKRTSRSTSKKRRAVKAPNKDADPSP